MQLRCSSRIPPPPFAASDIQTQPPPFERRDCVGKRLLTFVLGSAAHGGPSPATYACARTYSSLHALPPHANAPFPLKVEKIKDLGIPTTTTRNLFLRDMKHAVHGPHEQETR